MKRRTNGLVNRLNTSLLIRFFLALILYPLLGAVIFFIARTLLGSVTWYGDELIYKLGHWISLRLEVFICLYLIIGYSFIFFYYWKKPFSYIQTMVDALDQMYDTAQDTITLPDALKEIETSINQSKMKIQENERIAKEAEQRKNDLVVYLAHDLKTPLTSVIGYLTLLHDENQISEALREKYLSIARDKAERLEDLINEFFEITRFNLSNITLETGQVNLTRMLEQIVYEFQPMLAEKSLKCILHAPADHMITCDADKMQRVFDNLLRNAVNYSFAESEIHITVEKTETHFNIFFRNQGNTIPKEKLHRIFEQFYRLDSSRTTKSGGAGLGLAIAKEIVELHQGTITAQSQDETVVFLVTLPQS